MFCNLSKSIKIGIGFCATVHKYQLYVFNRKKAELIRTQRVWISSEKFNYSSVYNAQYFAVQTTPEATKSL